MRVLIMSDMEGVSGIVVWDQVNGGAPMYEDKNIIENAVDFARERVEVSATWDNADVSIAIADDGPGFSPEIMDTLGDPYITTRPAGGRTGAGARTGRVGAGLGLGFFIAKTLLERSGAQVTLANRRAPERGAIVKITWPRSASAKSRPLTMC